MTDIRLKDVVHHSSSGEVSNSLQIASTRLAAVAQNIKAHYRRTEQNLALYNLASRAAFELTRLARNLDQGTDLVAWATRNLFELNLSVRYILMSEDNASRYLAESAKDEQQVLEGFLSLSDNESVEARKVLQDRILAIDALATRHGIELRKPLSTSDLAKVTGCAAEYTALYKLMSKYVHPSSWLVCGGLI